MVELPNDNSNIQKTSEKLKIKWTSKGETQICKDYMLFFLYDSPVLLFYFRDYVLLFLTDIFLFQEVY